MKQEKKINNSPEPVSISGTKIILNQLMDCICKLKINGVNGTGFFCKINFGNNETKNFLITNYHVLNKKNYEENNKIILLLNDQEEIKNIDLKIHRNTYFNQENDITLIELNNNDNIVNFLELDDDLFRHNNNILYDHKSLYVLQYPQGKKAAVSYGLLTSLDKFEIKHTCSTDNGSSGSPILNLETNKVIGIHKEGSINFEFNKGTYLKYVLIDFIQKNINKINENNNNISNNISKNNNNIQNNLGNFGNMNFNNINLNLESKSSNLNNNIMNNHNNFIIAEFIQLFGYNTRLKLNPNITVNDMLINYLNTIKKPELIGQNSEITFLWDGGIFLFGDNTPISFYLNNLNYINIVVGNANLAKNLNNQKSNSQVYTSGTGELIPRKEDITYEYKNELLAIKNNNFINICFTIYSSGLKVYINAQKNMSFSELFKNFMKKIGKPEFDIGTKIIFISGGYKLDVKSQEPISKFFKFNFANVTAFDQYD